MESIISTFHLDLKLFIAQIINFGVVFAVLYWLAFKPLIKVMTERSQKIEQGLADAQASAGRLAKSQLEQKKIIKQARQEAMAIIEQANQQAEIKGQAIIVKTKEDVAAMINQTKQKIQQEKAEVLNDIRKETADLIIKAVAKILPNKMSKEDERQLIKSFDK